jgi:hypothetical protein
MSYSENPATTESLARQREQPNDPDIPETPPLIDTPGTASTYITKSYRATFGQPFSKNTVTLSGFIEQQTDYVTQDGSLTPDDRAMCGVILDWAYDIGGKTQLMALGRWYNQQLTSDGTRGDFYPLHLTQVYTENQAGFIVDRTF